MDRCAVYPALRYTNVSEAKLGGARIEGGQIANKINKIDLGDKVVNHFISSLRTSEGIELEISLSRQGRLALQTLTTMINSLWP
jgi:hypothetical protein